MFQTEPIIWLQSLATPWLTEILLGVTRLGYSSFYVPALIVITFGIDFRRGFLLIQMMVWTGLITDLLKNAFAMPRPADIDAAVRLVGQGTDNPTPLHGMGGSGFWALPDPGAVEIVRARPGGSYGIPSGHVSGATVFWGGLAMVFPPRVFKVAAPLMIFLMALSRMYLGRHFLADVLAGFMLGVLVLGATQAGFFKTGLYRRLMAMTRLRLAADGTTAALAAFLLLAPAGLLALGGLVDPVDAGTLFGLNMAFLALAYAGLPRDKAAWFLRGARVVLAFVLYWASSGLLALIAAASPDGGHCAWMEFAAGAVPAFITLWGGVRIARASHFYADAPT